MTEQLEQSKQFLLLAVDDLCWEFGFESIHPSCEIVCFDSFGFCERAGLWRSTTRSADEDYLLRLIHLIHPKREKVKGDISCCRDIDFCIFSRSSDINKVDFFWRFLEEGSEFLGWESEHVSRTRWVTKWVSAIFDFCHSGFRRWIFTRWKEKLPWGMLESSPIMKSIFLFLFNYCIFQRF